MIKTIIKTALISFTYGALMLLAYAYGYRVGGRDGFRDGHVRGYWLGKEVECYLRERMKEREVKLSGDGWYTNGEIESEVAK